MILKIKTSSCQHEKQCEIRKKSPCHFVVFAESNFILTGQFEAFALAINFRYIKIGKCVHESLFRRKVRQHELNDNFII